MDFIEVLVGQYEHEAIFGARDAINPILIESLWRRRRVNEALGKGRRRAGGTKKLYSSLAQVK